MTTPDGAPRRRRISTKRVTLADVARAADVSAQTVSRAMRNHPDISDETRRHVQETVRRIGYVPNLMASNLASNVSRLVATIVPSISTSVFADTVSAASRVLEPAGYQMILGVTEYSSVHEEHLIEKLLGRRPDGILMVGTKHTAAASRMLRAAGVPVVETWGWTKRPVGSLVGYANDDAMHALAQEVLSAGYRNPVFIGSASDGDERARARHAGFTRAMREAFPEREPRFVDTEGRSLTLQSGDEMLTRARERHPDADVAMFATDILACGAVLGAARRGLRIPEDIAITGFGDFELATAMDPALSTVTIRSDRIGTESAEILLAQMRSETTGTQKVDLGYEVVLRGTT
ncbi:transcriptional regulator, LacI family [Paramicrobacterium humi]|uniref:Transcriptional regulator, LacI family n=1 Tax=Paramicrobacterium humi TaxID=640635 RepID=A0A1H4K9F5_9MICO|nr:LacI family DNA-binding transcriptional regulator [Microbacterium humi]SEB55174.1 transcriptional regulator, LacI family [Microbacterium humi]